MPTASPQVRKPWHEKKAWVRIEKAWNRGRLFWNNEQAGAWVFMRWMRIESGDIAAAEFLKGRGYRPLRGFWYAPKLERHRVKDWAPTPKEESALAYLVDEWDHSYDLRTYREIVHAKRNEIADAIDKAYMRGQRLSSQHLVAQLNRFAELVQTLS